MLSNLGARASRSIEQRLIFRALGAAALQALAVGAAVEARVDHEASHSTSGARHKCLGLERHTSSKYESRISIKAAAGRCFIQAHKL